MTVSAINWSDFGKVEFGQLRRDLAWVRGYLEAQSASADVCLADKVHQSMVLIEEVLKILDEKVKRK